MDRTSPWFFVTEAVIAAMLTHPDRKQPPVTESFQSPAAEAPAPFVSRLDHRSHGDAAVRPSALTSEPTDSLAVPPDGCSQYLLVCEARSLALDRGHWHFSLETAEGHAVFDAGDQEDGDLNRLTLLAAVRGLEAIDGAASVTLLSNNRYLIRSLTDSLPRWRENDFAWEHFGRRIDVQHADLWRRVNRALAIHRVEACLISSRLISDGARPSPSGSQGGENRFTRVDGPHHGPRPPKLRSVPQDRLRRWLLAGQPEPPPAPRHRFTPADLAAPV